MVIFMHRTCFMNKVNVSHVYEKIVTLLISQNKIARLEIQLPAFVSFCVQQYGLELPPPPISNGTSLTCLDQINFSRGTDDCHMLPYPSLRPQIHRILWENPQDAACLFAD